MTQLTHFDEQGASRMVDVNDKEITDRVSTAHAKITMKPETFQLIMDKKIQKGDVFEVARIAGIMAAKQTSRLIPMCHPLNLTSVKIDYTNNSADTIDIFSEIRVTGKTGVEMEAITAASICAITIYDMCKSMDKGMVISDIHLVKKSGGKSGSFFFEIYIERFNFICRLFFDKHKPHIIIICWNQDGGVYGSYFLCINISRRPMRMPPKGYF